MKKKYILIQVLAVLTLAACSDSRNSNFVEACMASSNMGKDICACVADKADDMLSPVAYDFLIISMTEGKRSQEVSEARAKMNIQEAVEAGMFMVNTPAKCTAEK